MSASLIATGSVRLALRESTVLLMAGLFAALVLVSAWLGWQATDTVNRIYLDAARFLAAAGKPVPTNPVLDTSPLILMRNMSVYVILIGALSAIVIGNRLVALDRKAGVLPLIASRPLTKWAYATGKLLALALLVGGLFAVATLVGTATLLLLPSAVITASMWVQLFGFFALSGLYMLIFGLIALAATSAFRSESVGLLVPVTVWLAVTFILPALTLNLTPTAVLNPISALATPPDTSFFRLAGWGLGPFSLAESYGALSAGLLDYRPAEWLSRAVLPPLVSLVAALGIAAMLATRALNHLSPIEGGYDA
jgi:ABC-type transport system involved in multi-copper enzyme maturation permease subunit